MSTSFLKIYHTKSLTKFPEGVISAPMSLPTISVIIPRKAAHSAENAIQAVLDCEYPQHLIEIIEVIGEQPSKQRNMGAAAAKGEILYFLDNDSIMLPHVLSHIAGYYTGKQSLPEMFPCAARILAGIGGPNLTPESDNFWQRLSGYALASFFAHFTMSARYKSVGKLRYAGEQELILCNFSIRRDIFLQEGGFNESLYPNEENEFLNRLKNKGYRFLYAPEAIVFRSRRNHLRSFIKQLFHYGRGRAEQIVVEGFLLTSLLFFLPTGLLGYLVLLLLWTSIYRFLWWTLLPLLLYGLLAGLSALQWAVQSRNPFLLLMLPFWYLVMHLSYGTGLLYGFGNSLNSSSKKPSSSPSSLIEVIFRKPFNL